MPLKIVFKEFNTGEDGLRFYVSASPIDPGNPPAPVDETGDSSTLVDESATYGADAVSHTVAWDATQSAYVRVAAFTGGVEVASEEWYYEAGAAPVPATGLTVWYKVDDESAGTLPDSAGGDNNGTLVGGVTTTTGVLGGSALVFDGVNGYVDTNFKTDGGDYYLSFWASVDDLLKTQAIYAETDSTNNSYGALIWTTITTELLQFGHFTNTSGVWDPTSFDFRGMEGRLAHIVASREDGVTHELYVNNVLVDSVPCSSVLSPSSFTGKLGGNPDNAGGRYLAGMIARDPRFYKGAPATPADVDALYQEHAGNLTVTLDENFIFTDEGDSLTGWTVDSGNPSVVGSEIVLAADGTRDQLTRNISLPPASADFIVYIKLRVDQVSGQYSYVQIQDGANNQCSFIMGYNWVTGSPQMGTISASLQGGAQKLVLETGADTQNGREYAIHCDRDRNAISFYRVTATGWELKGSVTFFAAWATIDTLYFSQGSTGANLEAALDYFSIARPNFLAIGDSICAGHTGFDPSPAYYAGVDDVANSWQGNFRYPGLRNNLVVNKGIGSQTSAQTLARIDEAYAHGARYVFLHASTNDYGAPITLADRTTNIQDTIDALRVRGCRIVLLNSIYANANHASNPAGAAYYLDWWSNYRSGLTGVYQAIDIMQPVIDVGTGYLDTAYAESDGIHPNLSGYTQIGSYLETEFSHVA